jgi:glucose-6-phosphate 1-dehydrogenase
VTRTEVVARLRAPPPIMEGINLPSNYLRFRLTPEFVIALGAVIRAPGDRLMVEPVELNLMHTQAGALEPYEELLGDAMRGDAFRFAREDYVEEAWRIVDPAIKANTQVYEYEPGTWGPKEAEAMIPGGWYVAKG